MGVGGEASTEVTGTGGSAGGRAPQPPPEMLLPALTFLCNLEA